MYVYCTKVRCTAVHVVTYRVVQSTFVRVSYEGTNEGILSCISGNNVSYNVVRKYVVRRYESTKVQCTFVLSYESTKVRKYFEVRKYFRTSVGPTYCTIINSRAYVLPRHSL